MALEQVRAAAVDAGLTPADFAWGEDVVEHRWTVRLEDGAYVLGGVDHGAWREWRRFAAGDGVTDLTGVDDVVKALWDLRRRPEPARIPRALDETATMARLGVEMMDRAAGWAGSDAEPATHLPASEVKVGTPLDHVGDESGHVLHHFGTSWGRRALPDSARPCPVTGYLLVHVLPVTCHAEKVAPAHGHPGGAWRVVLDKPIAAYVESGALRPFIASDS